MIIRKHLPQLLKFIFSSFPHCAGGFELTIRANGDQAEEEEAVEDEDKEEEDPSLGLLRVLGEYMG